MLFHRLPLDALECRIPRSGGQNASANTNAIILGICLSQIKAIMLAECNWGVSADDSDIRAN